MTCEHGYDYWVIMENPAFLFPRKITILYKFDLGLSLIGCFICSFYFLSRVTVSCFWILTFVLGVEYKIGENLTIQLQTLYLLFFRDWAPWAIKATDYIPSILFQNSPCRPRCTTFFFGKWWISNNETKMRTSFSIQRSKDIGKDQRSFGFHRWDILINKTPMNARMINWTSFTGITFRSLERNNLCAIRNISHLCFLLWDASYDRI